MRFFLEKFIFLRIIIVCSNLFSLRTVAAIIALLTYYCCVAFDFVEIFDIMANVG